MGLADDGQAGDSVLEGHQNTELLGVRVLCVVGKLFGNSQGLGGKINLVACALLGSHNHNSFPLSIF